MNELEFAVDCSLWNSTFTIKYQWATQTDCVGGPCGIIKGQGTGKVCSLYQGFVLSRFFSSHFTIAGVKKIVCYTEDFVVYRGSTVHESGHRHVAFFPLV